MIGLVINSPQVTWQATRAFLVPTLWVPVSKAEPIFTFTIPRATSKSVQGRKFNMYFWRNRCYRNDVVQLIAFCYGWSLIAVNCRRQDVYEKATVEPFTCTAEAFPNAKYYWNFQEGNFTTIGPTLTFRHGIRRYQVIILTFLLLDSLSAIFSCKILIISGWHLYLHGLQRLRQSPSLSASQCLLQTHLSYS